MTKSDAIKSRFASKGTGVLSYAFAGMSAVELLYTLFSDNPTSRAQQREIELR